MSGVVPPIEPKSLPKSPGGGGGAGSLEVGVFISGLVQMRVSAHGTEGLRIDTLPADKQAPPLVIVHMEVSEAGAADAKGREAFSQLMAAVAAEVIKRMVELHAGGSFEQKCGVVPTQGGKGQA